jgi:2-succinyl-6-hydroxy-2,4-cyclohexadiene-1-carboxylate synthase
MRCALLHGFAGDPAVWGDVLAAWPDGTTASTVALPGHIRVPDARSWPVLPTWDENLAAVGQLVRECDVVVGYSLGARVALGLVAAGLAPRAVLIGVNPGIDDSERPARRDSDARWAALLRAEGVAAFDARWTAQPLFATQVRAPAVRRAERHANRLRLDARQLARSLETMGVAEMPDYRPQLASLADRIALIAGEDDAKYAELAKALPCAHRELIPDCGHDPTLEQPAALASSIARALAAIGSATKP